MFFGARPSLLHDDPMSANEPEDTVTFARTRRDAQSTQKREAYQPLMESGEDLEERHTHTLLKGRILDI